MGIDYGGWVKLYQSRHFKDEFPEDNDRFKNIMFSDDVGGDREKSLLTMRKKMFTDHQFTAAVFIGGMGGIVDEYDLFHSLQPNAAVLPIVSSGGAALKVAERMGSVSPDLANDLDYVALFHRHLSISVQEGRFARPEDQPASVDQRLYRPPSAAAPA
jgi:hypothetical protein